jgi:DNA-binding transcriptional LysR family regulator
VDDSPLDLKQLRTFLTVARLRSFTAAARELAITQPAVSGHVHKLEASLGCKLVELVAGRVQLTAAGQALLDSGPQVMAAARVVLDRVQAADGLHGGTLRIGASTTPGIHVLPAVLRAFRESHPEVTLRCTIRGTQQVEELLAQGDLDCALVGGHMSARELEMTPFMDDELVLVAAVDHPLARRELETASWVMREAGSATRRRLEQFLSQEGVAPKVSVEVDSPEAVKSLVAAGLGLSAVSRHALHRDPSVEGLAVLPTRRRMKRELSLATLSSRDGSPVVDAFLGVARTVAGRLSKEAPRAR